MGFVFRRGRGRGLRHALPHNMGMKLDVNECAGACMIGRSRDNSMLSKEMMDITGHYWTLWHSLEM